MKEMMRKMTGRWGWVLALGACMWWSGAAWGAEGDEGLVLSSDGERYVLGGSEELGAWVLDARTGRVWVLRNAEDADEGEAYFEPIPFAPYRSRSGGGSFAPYPE